MILFKIYQQLPNYLQFPTNPKTNLWEYYRMLQTSTVFHDNQIFVVISIPLLDKGETMDIYKIHNLPLPNHKMYLRKHKIPKDTSKMIAKYELETNIIAVDKQRSRYLLLNNQEAKDCSRPVTEFYN